MANTVDTGLLPRTYFKAPRVPFDFRALGLGMLGYLVYWGGSLLLDEIFGKVSIVGSFLKVVTSIFQGIPFIDRVVTVFTDGVFTFGQLGNVNLADYSFWHQLVGGVWIFLVWSFFGQAIHRITSLRIARDEGLSFREAFVFAAKNWMTVILAPIVIALTIAFFYGCNALAGLVISIPFVGQILGLILVPLALISSLLILLIALGGVFGLPLIGAAAAWERNGTLDAISRAFSYIFARPLQFFWNYFLIFLFVGVILLVGSWFVFVLTKSVDAGVLSDRLSILIDAPERTNSNEDYTDLDPALQTEIGNLETDTGYKAGRNAPHVQPFAKDLEAVSVGGLTHGLNAITFWVVLNLIWLGIFGYAIYWFLGATTSVYADLRADVDGTEDDEIYLEEEEEDFDALAEAATEAERATAPPTAETDKPTADAGAPAAETDKPTAETDKPTAETDKPTAETSEPAAEAPQPDGSEPAGSEAPEQASDEGEKPATD